MVPAALVQQTVDLAIQGAIPTRLDESHNNRPASSPTAGFKGTEDKTFTDIPDPTCTYSVCRRAGRVSDPDIAVSSKAVDNIRRIARGVDCPHACHVLDTARELCTIVKRGLVVPAPAHIMRLYLAALCTSSMWRTTPQHPCSEPVAEVVLRQRLFVLIPYMAQLLQCQLPQLQHAAVLAVTAVCDNTENHTDLVTEQVPDILVQMIVDSPALAVQQAAVEAVCQMRWGRQGLVNMSVSASLAWRLMPLTNDSSQEQLRAVRRLITHSTGVSPATILSDLDVIQPLATVSRTTTDPKLREQTASLLRSAVGASKTKWLLRVI